MGTTTRRDPHGFTLIELLVVLAVVGLMVSLILPAMGRARDVTKASLCLSNMRHLGVATGSYLQDYRTVFPQPDNDSHNRVAGRPDDENDPVNQRASGSAMWFNALDVYLDTQRKNYRGSGGTGANSAAEQRNYVEFKQDPVWNSFPVSQKIGASVIQVKRDSRTIKMNGNFGQVGAGVRWVRDIDLRQPSRTVMFIDGRAYDLLYTDVTSTRLFYATEGRVGLRHNSGANVCFADGSASHAVQPLRTTTLTPSWYLEPDQRQMLVWTIP